MGWMMSEDSFLNGFLGGVIFIFILVIIFGVIFHYENINAPMNCMPASLMRLNKDIKCTEKAEGANKRISCVMEN